MAIFEKSHIVTLGQIRNVATLFVIKNIFMYNLLLTYLNQGGSKLASSLEIFSNKVFYVIYMLL